MYFVCIFLIGVKVGRVIKKEIFTTKDRGITWKKGSI